MALFRRKTSSEVSRSELDQEKTELEVESVLIHVKILARELMGALDDLEEAMTDESSPRSTKNALANPKERHEPPF